MMHKTITGQIWKLDISASALHMIHGMKRTIYELYIPDLKICFNTADGVSVFKLNNDNAPKPIAGTSNTVTNNQQKISSPEKCMRIRRQRETRK